MEADKAMVVARPQMPITSVADLEKIGELFERSGMFGCSKQGQGMVLAMSCHLGGMTPLEFRAKYHLIDGNPCMKAEAMLAEFSRIGGKYRVLARTDERAEVELTMAGQTQKFCLTWDEAKGEPFVWKTDKVTHKPTNELKTNWATSRTRMQMLWARVISDSIRVMAPQVNMGTYTPEEVQDFAPTVDVTPPSGEYTPPRAIKEPIGRKPKTPPATEPATTTPADSPATPPPVTVAAELVTDDPGMVPAGPAKGKPWADFDDEKLATYRASKHPSMTDAHRAAIDAVLVARKVVAK